jgi:hypothetical protein
MLVELISCIYLYQYLNDFMTLHEINIDRTVTKNQRGKFHFETGYR